MKITGNTSEFFSKLAQAQPAVPATPAAGAEPAQPQGKRDGKSIADALVKSAEGLGLLAFSLPIGDAILVSCRSRTKTAQEEAEIQFSFTVPSFGDMEGSIDRGLEKGDGVRKVFRQIVANAVKEAGIVAIPTQTDIDTVLAVNPNHYRELAATQPPPVQQPNSGGAI